MTNVLLLADGVRYLIPADALYDIARRCERDSIQAVTHDALKNAGYLAVGSDVTSYPRVGLNIEVVTPNATITERLI